MLTWIFTTILRIAGSGLLDKALTTLQAGVSVGAEKEEAQARVAIEGVKAEMARREAQKEVLLAEQGRRATALMRPAFAYPLAIYYGAVIADSLGHFRWNVAALPSPIGDWSGWIISAIFLSESGERIARTFARRPTK